MTEIEQPKELQPNYYAVIPADVRYAKISPNAKLLYGEISALANYKGFCWASNAYFANLYESTPNSISRWVGQLEKAGFIFVEVQQATGNMRRLTLSPKMVTLSPKMVRPLTKNGEHNNTSNKDLTKVKSMNVNLTKEKDVLELVSRLTGRSFRVLPRGSAKTLKLFSVAEIGTAIGNLSRDDWHADKIKEFSLSYLLRAETIDKFLTVKVDHFPASEGWRT